MQLTTGSATLLLLLFIFSCETVPEKLLSPADKTMTSSIDGIVYQSGNWPHPPYGEPFESLGNHRFLVEVPEGTELAQAVLPWRRSDAHPAAKDIVIVKAETNEQVKNKFVAEIDQEKGRIFFEPLADAQRYFVYYLPHKSTGGYYPKLSYWPSRPTAEERWQEGLSPERLRSATRAKVLSAESIDDFHSFFPMEIIATREEVKTFQATYPKDFYLFPEYRDFPIRMTDHLPKHWMDRGLLTGLRDTVRRGEYYSFQIGLFAPATELRDVQVSFSDLRTRGGNALPAEALSCFNTEGVDLNGQPFEKRLQVPAGKVQALWLGVDIPEDAPKGVYRGQIHVQPMGFPAANIELVLEVRAETVANHGDDEPEKMSRLRWLNSTIGADPGFITPPFEAVRVEGRRLGILGREVVLNDNGLPAAIESYFPQELTYLLDRPEAVLDGPIAFGVVSDNGEEEVWESEGFEVGQPSPGQAGWQTRNESDNFQLVVQGALEYDGMLQYQLQLIPKKVLTIKDAYLDVPMESTAAVYMLGLGRKGGRRPAEVDWRWDVANHHEGVWLGNVNKGLQYVLRDRNYQRPLNTNFYQAQPLNLPPSWYNEGRGGIRIDERDGAVVARNYCGPRTLQPGDTLHFHIRFLITPFKTIDTKKHFNTRFVHKYVPVDSARALGGTVINVHHANEINPYINYPFYNLEAQKAYIDEAHRKGVKVKLYNTIRELTYKAHELFALRSLGDEILNDGEGGGHAWLQEHLRDHYHSAWHAWRVNDAAILNKGTSRWTNYYIEGLNWLAQNQEIDGLYLDDIAFSRETVKRISNVLHAHRPEVIIDLHSANQFNPRDGFINSAFLYMEHFPYISRLWFGEYFEYDLDPDYWLTEVSGLPFGLMGEMLEKCGHPYRGLVYGMTTRNYGTCDPSALWKFFDEFKIADSEMLGYWVDRNPVKVSNSRIRCTIYRQDGQVLIVLGSWSERDERVELEIDWQALGIDEKRVELISPAIEGLQEKQTFKVGQPVTAPGGQGMILLLRK